MMRLRDFSCGLFFMLQVSGTIVMYIKGRKHKLQRSAFYFMFYLLLISVFEFYVFFIDNILGSQERPVTDMLQTTAVPLALFLLYRLTHPYNMRFVAAACNVAPYVLAISHTSYSLTETCMKPFCGWRLHTPYSSSSTEPMP